MFSSSGLRDFRSRQAAFPPPAKAPPKVTRPKSTTRRYLLDQNAAPGSATRTFTKAKSVYSSGSQPRQKSRPKPEWNPYKKDDKDYGKLTREQLEKRREMFKSKNNILHSPEAKAKAIKEKKRARVVKKKKAVAKEAAALALAKEAEAENIEPNPSPHTVPSPSPNTPNAAATLLSLRAQSTTENTDTAPDSSVLASKVSALSISETLKNYETTLANLEKRVEKLPTKAPILVKENEKVAEIMESVSTTPPTPETNPTTSPVEGVGPTTDLLMKIANLEAICNNQREYIASHIAPIKNNSNNNNNAAPDPPTSSRTPPTPPPPPSLAPMPKPSAVIRTSDPLSNIMGFENKTGYISGTDALTGPVPLQTSSQVYADIKRAKEHAEYLAGVKAREWGYQGGVGELEEDDKANENDISSMPLQSSPQPQPRPTHPFKSKQKVTFSPNVPDEPESTVYRKVVTRVGARSDWGAPTA